MTLVLDANVAVAACAEPDGFEEFRDDELVAPPLLWSEFFSLAHEARFRGELTNEQAGALVTNLARESCTGGAAPDRLGHR